MKILVRFMLNQGTNVFGTTTCAEQKAKPPKSGMSDKHREFTEIKQVK
jgi:hypothetical protein